MAEAEPQCAVRFFEDEAVAVKAFIQMARDGIDPLVALREGFPEKLVLAATDAQDRFASSDILRVVNLVIRVVRKNRPLGITPPCGQGTVTGNKYPVVGTAHQTHEEWRHLVVMADPVKYLVILQPNKFARNLAPALWPYLLADESPFFCHGTNRC